MEICGNLCALQASSLSLPWGWGHEASVWQSKRGTLSLLSLNLELPAASGLSPNCCPVWGLLTSSSEDDCVSQGPTRGCSCPASSSCSRVWVSPQGCPCRVQLSHPNLPAPSMPYEACEDGGNTILLQALLSHFLSHHAPLSSFIHSLLPFFFLPSSSSPLNLSQLTNLSS